MKSYFQTLVLLVVLTGKACGQGTILWNESVDGSFSHDFNAPTFLSPLQGGTNSIIGATELQPTPPNYAGYPDYFVIKVPSGTYVTGLYLQIDKPNVWTWVGDTNYQNVLSYSLNPSSGNLLSQLGLNSIGSGAYGMYMLNNDAQPILSVANYRLDFFVQNIPERSTLALALLGAGVFLSFSRKRWH